MLVEVTLAPVCVKRNEIVRQYAIECRKCRCSSRERLRRTGSHKKGTSSLNDPNMGHVTTIKDTNHHHDEAEQPLWTVWRRTRSLGVLVLLLRVSVQPDHKVEWRSLARPVGDNGIGIDSAAQ